MSTGVNFLGFSGKPRTLQNCVDRLSAVRKDRRERARVMMHDPARKKDAKRVDSEHCGQIPTPVVSAKILLARHPVWESNGFS